MDKEPDIFRLKLGPCPSILFLSGHNVRTRNKLAISHVQLLSTQLAPQKLINFSWSSPSWNRRLLHMKVQNVLSFEYNVRSNCK